MGDKVFIALMTVHRIARTLLHQRLKANLPRSGAMLGISILAIATLLSACSAPTPTVTNLPQQTETSAPPATLIPSPTATLLPTTTPAKTAMPPQQTAQSTSLDPCQLITSQEAASLTGVSFGAGSEATIPGGGKTCTYGSQTTNIFFVEVVQAADETTAKAAQEQFLTDLQANLQQLTSQGFTITQLPNFADGGVIAQLSINAAGQTINGSAIGFRKGTIFFGFSDIAVGSAAPNSEALQSEATTVLGRLP